MSYRRLPENAHTNWGSYNYYTYVKVKPGTDMAVFDEKIQEVHDKNVDEVFSDFYTQPLLDIHLNSKLKWELEPNGDKLYVSIFIIIGAFILLIAGINYINLSTAKSSQRAKETGIRKVAGAGKRSLVFQFLLESLILSLISAIFALMIAWLLLPVVNELTQKQLNLINNPLVIIYVLLVTLLIGGIAGLFPALYLSSFRPVQVLKGFKLNEKGALNLRKALVIVQFTISIALIVSALIIMRQIDYLQSAKLGFDKEQVLVINNVGNLTRADREPFLNTVKQMTGIENAAVSGTVLGRGFNTARLRAQGSEQEQQLNYSFVGFDYLDVVGIEMKEGRGFSHEYPADTITNGISGGPLNQRLGGIVINEQAVREFGLPTPTTGERLIWSNEGDTVYYVEVIGIAKDFHFTSLRNEIKPYGFMMLQNGYNNITVKLSTADIANTVQNLESEWKTRFPEVPFDYLFLDDTFAKMYVAEARFQKVFISMVVLGIIIACLGLFALSVFSAEQRIKEIGIRKVLGASVRHLVLLLSTGFLKLVVISIIIAIPLAAYTMQTWLNGFAYRIKVEWWLFAIAAALAIIIAFFTISINAVKAALSDPVKSIKAE